MNQPESKPAVHYIASIQNVQEVVLSGTADYDYWKAHLTRQRRCPYSVYGQALLSISATQLVWMGIRFKEITVSIQLSDEKDPGRQGGFYLIQAFNSLPLLSFAEQIFFETPYLLGDIQVENHFPASFSIKVHQGIMLGAKMSGQSQCIRSGDEMWEGAIFLPENRVITDPSRKLFYACLGGYTETYPFIPAADLLEIKTSRETPVFGWLIESGFAAKEWHLRSSATHKRSKTYRLDSEG